MGERWQKIKSRWSKPRPEGLRSTTTVEPTALTEAPQRSPEEEWAADLSSSLVAIATDDLVRKNVHRALLAGRENAPIIEFINPKDSSTSPKIVLTPPHLNRSDRNRPITRWKEPVVNVAYHVVGTRDGSRKLLSSQTVNDRFGREVVRVGEPIKNLLLEWFDQDRKLPGVNEDTVLRQANITYYTAVQDSTDSKVRSHRVGGEVTQP